MYNATTTVSMSRYKYKIIQFFFRVTLICAYNKMKLMKYKKYDIGHCLGKYIRNVTYIIITIDKILKFEYMMYI